MDQFGRQVSTLTGNAPSAYGFSTKQMDPTGLIYYGLRYYSPALGQWISRDPMKERGGLNLYGFVRNRPTDAIDPDGRLAHIVIGAVIGGGFDLTAQLLANHGNLSAVNWWSVGGSIVLGATGVGLAESIGGSVARTGLSVGGKFAARAALNGLGNAGLGAADASIRNALEHPSCKKRNVAESAFIAGLMGSAGSAVGDLAQAGVDRIFTEQPGSFAQELIDSGALSGGWDAPFTPRPGEFSNVATSAALSGATIFF